MSVLLPPVPDAAPAPEQTLAPMPAGSQRHFPGSHRGGGAGADSLPEGLGRGGGRGGEKGWSLQQSARLRAAGRPWASHLTSLSHHSAATTCSTHCTRPLEEEVCQGLCRVWREAGASFQGGPARLHRVKAPSIPMGKTRWHHSHQFTESTWHPRCVGATGVPLYRGETEARSRAGTWPSDFRDLSASP